MTSSRPHERTQPRPSRLFGLFMAVAAVLAAVLSIQRVSGAALPGCGADSPCAAAQGSVWGRVPGVEWPVSFLGTAYFVGMLAAWLAGGRRVSTVMGWVATLGATASIGYLLVIVFGKYFCAYCIGAHAANLLAWFSTRSGPVMAGTAKRSLMVGLATAVTASAGLAIADQSATRSRREIAEREARESTERIMQAARQASRPAAPMSGPSPAAETRAPSTTCAVASAPSDRRPTGVAASRPFTGRYRLGPAEAAVRIVVFSDYQCPACKIVDAELRRLHAARPEVSISHKHFPMCVDCNRHAGRTMHANACWAARAAETAGLLRGEAGFRAMHQALFDRGGAFTKAELQKLLTDLGYDDPAAFEKRMASAETMNLVKADADEAMSIGMRYTPMVMINGVEFKGWDQPGAITRGVERILADSPPVLGPEADRPLPAQDKFVADWRSAARTNLSTAGPSHRLGPENAAVRVVFFGDYCEPVVANIEKGMREEVLRRGDTSMVYVNFPFNKECNPSVSGTRSASACLAARAAEAAGVLDGIDGFRRMHDWLMNHSATLNESTIRAACEALGFDADELMEAATAAAAGDALGADVVLSARAGVKSLPAIFVNERLVPQAEHEGRSVLPRILEEAAADARAAVGSTSQPAGEVEP